MILRPNGLLISGELRLGLEIVREHGRILAIRPHTGIPESFIVSVPFVNAHSHLEYRGMQGELIGRSYWDWIRRLTQRKSEQSEAEVRADCATAAEENRQTGVGLIGEHSDRPFAGEALTAVGIGGTIFQEVITFFERDSRAEKLAQVRAHAEINRRSFMGEVVLNPHALFTVDPDTLAELGRAGGPVSLHLAESVHERAFYERGEGPIADFYERFGLAGGNLGKSPLQVADILGLVRSGAQMVHACDLDDSDIALLAKSGACVVHCPRSNEALGCPDAPIFEYLRKGIDVGLGLDSAASSGPIDMFDEMRAALRVAERRGRPITGKQVWNMATTMGARTLGARDWDIVEGFEGPLIAIDYGGAETSADLVAAGAPEQVRWIP